MVEQNSLKLIQLAISKLTKSILFRNNTGVGWVGSTKRARNGGIYIEEPRPLHAGLCVGSSDLIGWTEIVVTPEMVGAKIAVFTAIEVKKIKGSTTSSEQLKFINRIKDSGGIAGIAKTPEDAVNLLNNLIKGGN